MAQYINKDALVAEIEKLLDKGRYHEEYDCAYRDGNNDALYALKNKLDSLEMKEVGLEEEITSQIRLLNGVHTLDNGKQWWKGTYNELSYFAKHFFELGLKTQKGEYQGEQKPIEINYEELIEKRKQTLMAWSEFNDAAFREANLLGYDQAIKDILNLINKKED